MHLGDAVELGDSPLVSLFKASLKVGPFIVGKDFVVKSHEQAELVAGAHNPIFSLGFRKATVGRCI